MENTVVFIPSDLHSGVTAPWALYSSHLGQS